MTDEQILDGITKALKEHDRNAGSADVVGRFNDGQLFIHRVSELLATRQPRGWKRIFTQ